MNRKIKKTVSVLLLFIILVMPASVYAGEKHPSRVMDGAGLFDADEEEVLIETLNEISGRQKFDVVVITADSSGNSTIEDMARDIYDEKGYGYGKNHDGAVLLLTMENRQWYICTTGYGITAITDDGIRYMGEQMHSELKNGNYLDACTRFAKMCDDFVSEARTGKPYNGSHMPVSMTEVILTVIAGIVIGFAIALLLAVHRKKEMTTIEFQEDAYQYTCDGSIQLHSDHDRFVHQFVTTRIIEDKDNNTSTVSRGSSGTAHGGGGGSF